jgi:taurine dioxygenase
VSASDEPRVSARPSGFGAEITGVDLSRALPPAALARVKQAFADHRVVWFPNQPMNLEQQEAFTLQFGPFGAEPFVETMKERPHVVEVRRDPDERTHPFGGGWHSDWSFQERPPAASILHAKVVPPEGGDTLFADGIGAYEALSPLMQRLLADLRVVHSAANIYGPDGYFAKQTGASAMKAIVSADADRTRSHPLVRTHPVSKRRSLFTGSGYAIGIEGMSQGEGDALLGYLLSFMTSEPFVYRHQWTPNMLTMWDNCAALHHATGGYDGHLRLMHRTTVAGETPR